MTVDDLQALYSELRGSRSAPAIMDARAFFLERQMQEAHVKLNEAYEKYSESRQRILRQDPEKQVDAKSPDRDRQVRRLQRKQDKAREIIESFEEYLGQLKKLAEKEKKREGARVNQAEPESVSTNVSPVEPVTVKKESFDEEFLSHFSNLIGDRQLDLVTSRFGFLPLSDIIEVQSDAVYLLRKGDSCLLINSILESEGDSKLTCVDLCNAKNRVRLSPEAMIKLSVRRRLVMLLKR